MKNYLYTIVVTACVLITLFFVIQFYQLRAVVIQQNSVLVNDHAVIAEIVSLINKVQEVPPADAHVNK